MNTLVTAPNVDVICHGSGKCPMEPNDDLTANSYEVHLACERVLIEYALADEHLQPCRRDADACCATLFSMQFDWFQRCPAY